MDSWKLLKSECADCSRCELCETRTNLVFGVGNEAAEVMFIGEGPGEQEDLQGEPFVGPAGKLLDDMLEMIDLDRSRVYIANIVKCRPPHNRVPEAFEQNACLPYLRAQFVLVRPKILVCLGATAAKAVIRPDLRITRERGIWVDKKGTQILPTYHPSALLRDQIMAIDRVAAGQKVVMESDTEMDVIALAGTTHAVCAAVLRYRDGRLTDKREFLFRDTTDIDAVREEFLPQYYLDGETIPKTIAVDALPPDAEALNEALNQARGTKVELYVPQRGDVAKLVTMAYTNAVERLGRESGRYTREEKLLEEAAQVLGLKKPPRVIESYDISNWGDGTSVCGMVTFRDGKPYKAGYRKFKLKTVAGTDDYASLAETVSRRAAEYKKYSEMAANGEPSSNYFGQKPDLLLMDGGRGQVSAAKAALAGTALADVPLYGMVKDDHHRTRAIVDSEGREIAINMNRGTFTFVTAIQDETHRFANAYRKQQMKQKSYSSTLTEVPGVGPKTAKALMAQFKSVGAVKEATPDQLENTPGVGRQMAQTIYEYFHPQG